MATKADLAKRVLQKLRVLGAGREPAAEDNTLVGNALDELHADLRNRGLTNDGSGTWTIETVPPYAVRPYVHMVTAELADEFHVPEDRIVRHLLSQVEAENRIRRNIMVPNDGEPVKAEQF